MAKSRIVLITGASRGIGKFLTEYYLSKGYKVIGCSRNNTEFTHENYIHYSLDVSNEMDVVRVIKEIIREKKRLDVLINNAGIASMNHSLLTPMTSFENIFKTNTFGTFLFSREAAKAMIRQDYGRIVNFSTVGVPFRLEGECAYNASKAAIEMITRVMARELGNYSTTINAIGPTPMKTDLIKNVPEDKIENILSKQGIKHFASFEDIANVIDFFLREESRMVTGQVVYLGGVG